MSTPTGNEPSATGNPQCVLVLGASGTLGGRIARELIARGYNTGLHYCTHQDRCDQLAGDAKIKGTESRSYAADFKDTEAPQKLAAAFVKDFGRIDALICAAGIVREAPLISLKDSDLRDVLNVNLRSVFLIFKALSRQWIKQRSGSIVALSSYAAVSGRAGGSAYAMAQSGLISLVKSASRELGAFNVRVNAVLPPFVPESAMGQAASPEFAAAAKAKRVLKSTADPADAVANFVAELLKNGTISGQVLSTDSRIIG
jgi:3-oxoacyl-[acyl-carrier protein] reductase